MAAAALLTLLIAVSPDVPVAPAAAVGPVVPEAPAGDGGPAPSVAPQLSLPSTRLPAEDQPVVDEPLAPPPAPLPTADQYQAALAAAHDASDAFGVTFAAVRDGVVLWSGASGTAQNGRTPLTADSAMVVGSITKTFVSATVLQLVDEGRVALDDAVISVLPELEIDPKITVRQLLNHTSGLADVFNDTTRQALELSPAEAWSPAAVLETVAEPWYKPGEGYAYANTNYLLLALIVERLTGAPLADELARRFIGPLALGSTGLIAADTPGAPLSPAWASIFFGSGAMSSSANDLARWGDAVYDGGVLSGGARAQMLAFHGDDQGLGVQRIQLTQTLEGYGHTGLLHTYTTMLVYLPQQDVTLALLVNRSHADLERMLKAKPESGASVLSLVMQHAAALQN